MRQSTLLLFVYCLFVGFFIPPSAASSPKPQKTLRDIVRKGLVMFKKGELLKSEYYFREALKAYPENPRLQNNLGVVLKSSGYVTEAEVRFKKSISMAPWYQEAYFNLASLYLFLSYRNKAVEVSNKSLQWGADSIDWGFFFYDNQALADAKRIFYSYIEVNPNDYLGYYGAGITLYSLRQLAPAMHELLEAEKRSANNPVILNALGVIIAEKGNFEEAKEKFNKAASEPGLFIAPHVNLAKLYKKLNMLPESRKVIDDLMAKKEFALRFSAELESLRGEFLYLEGKKDKAKPHFVKARKQDKSNKHFFLYNLGIEMENRGKFESAIEKYIEALKIDVTAYDAWFRLGLCYFYTDKFTKALDAYTNAGKYRKDFLLDYYIGICYKDMHEWKDAILYLNKSIAKKNSAKAHLALALIYKRLAKTDRALVYFNNLLIMEPQNSYAKKQITLLGGTSEQKQIKTLGQLPSIDSVKGILFEGTNRLEMLSKGKKNESGLEKAVTPVDSNGHYTLQLLSSKNLKDAEKFLLKLKAKKYDVVLREEKVAGKGTWYRIKLGRFSTISDAKKEGEKLKKREHLNYWISNITDNKGEE